MTNNRSTISGVGAVTGYGWGGREALWNGLVSGKSAAALHEGFGFGSDDHGGGPGWIVRVPEGGDQADGNTRFARAMRSAAREAIEDASERGWRPGSRVGLVHACVLGDLDMYRWSPPVSGSTGDVSTCP